eukprot:gene11282-3373_t
MEDDETLLHAWLYDEEGVSQHLVSLRGAVRKDHRNRERIRSCGGVEKLFVELSNVDHTYRTKSELAFTLAVCCDEEGKQRLGELNGTKAIVDIARQCYAV